MNLYDIENETCNHCGYCGELTYSDYTTAISCAWCGEVDDIENLKEQNNDT